MDIRLEKIVLVATFSGNLRIYKYEACVYFEKREPAEAEVYWHNRRPESAAQLPQQWKVSAYFQIHALENRLYGAVCE